MRRWWRRARLGLPTVRGLRPGGFFIPCRYAGLLPRPVERPPYGPVEALMHAHATAFLERLAGLRRHATAFAAIGGPPPAPRWDQDWFPRLDAAMTYALVHERRPRRIVEVGSGHSTRFLARAAADAGLSAEIVAIDPAPRAGLAGLPVRLLPTTVQAAGPAPFAALEAGDLLLVDSSHILMPGSDVDLLLNRVLPLLPAGVLVHLHDVFLPDDYPPGWAWRGYNEQLGVAALLAGGGWRPLFASRYAVTRLAAAVAASAAGSLPLPAGALESGLWLEKTARD
ncbi:MAG: class I SAM-dependent methyltransferase [Rhodospirillaceae bacterium]|nr:class I SAM-dependent methyltransferase [Rhodospirillaceae bacterium]